MPDPGRYSIENYLDDMQEFEQEPWERCGCAACQATMDALYGDALPSPRTLAPTEEDR